MTNLYGSWRRRSDPALALDDYFKFFGFNGLDYPFGLKSHTLGGKTEEIGENFEGYVQGAYKSNGIVFACMLARLLLFSEARFQFRRMRSGRPGELFGGTQLLPLEKPWQNATTGDLLTRSIQDVDLAGNFYARRPGRIKVNGRVTNPGQPTIRRLRPDWVTILIGSTTQDDDPTTAIDAEVVGYLYHPGGPGARSKPIPLLPEEVAHFAPIPDPLANFRGMSWITPVVREIMGDAAATSHKLRFFENGATPNIVVSFDAEIGIAAVKEWIEMFKAEHEGALNAYKTLFLGAGGKAEAVGANLRQADFKVTQGAGETRIAAAAGVPPVIVGLSEGLQAATYSNYGQARRRFADGTMRPLWRGAAGSLATLIDVPDGAELWYDDRDIPFLQEDQKDAAEIQQTHAISIKQLIDAGYEPASVVEAVTSGDLSRLKHTGLFSVQLQPPGTNEPDEPDPDDEPDEPDDGQ